MSQSQDDLSPGSQENDLLAPTPAAEHIAAAGDYPPQIQDTDDGTSGEGSSGSSDDSDDEDTPSGASTPVTETSDGTGEHSACHVQPTLLPGLTNLGSEDPAATEWVRYLVQAVGRDVLSFRRNTQVSYMVVERARDMVKAINGYIAKVDDDESEDGDWTSFFKYSKAIKPLEECAHSCCCCESLADQPRFSGSCSSYSTSRRARKNNTSLAPLLSLSAYHQPSAGPPTERSYPELWKVSVRVKSLWYARRVAYAIRHALKAVQDLFDEPDTDSQEDEHRQAQIHDDRTLLREIRDGINALISEDPSRHVLICLVFFVINLFIGILPT
jgi:hypothetical protein